MWGGILPCKSEIWSQVFKLEIWYGSFYSVSGSLEWGTNSTKETLMSSKNVNFEYEIGRDLQISVDVPLGA